MVGSVAAFIVGQGCDPKPSFGTPEGPFVGTIRTETNVTATGAAQTIGFFPNESLEQGFDLRVSIQPGAYAPGTRVTVRLVVGLTLDADADIVFNQIVGLAFEALQILPATVPPAIPLRVDAAGSFQPWPFEVLHARETDTKWTAVGTLPPPDANASFAEVSFDVDQPGLWALGQRPLPPSIQGHLDRVSVTCDGSALAAPPARFIDLAANRYAWTTTTAPGCVDVEMGTIHRALGYLDDCVGFQLDGMTFPSKVACFTVDPSGTTISWAINYDYTNPVTGCAQGAKVNESYQVTTTATPAPADAGCSVDGGTTDAGTPTDVRRGP